MRLAHPHTTRPFGNKLIKLNAANKDATLCIEFKADVALNVQWTEVPKGMVVHVIFQEGNLEWRRSNFQEWCRGISDTYQIMVSRIPNANGQLTLVLKKYY